MENKGIIAGIIVIIFLGVILVVTNRPVENSRSYDSTTASNGGLTSLIKETVKPGSGDRQVQVGDQIEVHYVGTLKDGKKFDSSRDRNQPFDFIVGQGVIEGWSEGVVGMSLDEIRKLSIPSNLGYGPNGTTGIPGGSDLYFEIELLKFLN